MTENLKVELSDVHKSFQVGENTYEALKGVSLAIRSGEFMGLVGPSGSGKTTLLNLVGGLDRPTAGRIRLDGKDLQSLDINALADFRNYHIGFIFQSFNLLPVYTAYENVEFPLLLQPGRGGAADQHRILEILGKVGLAEKKDKKPATLSGGECQRVAIARAMVKNPTLVLADEPTANLDAENSHHILRIMRDLNAEYGTTFIFSTHDEKIMQYLTRVVRLTDGTVESDMCRDGRSEKT